MKYRIKGKPKCKEIPEMIRIKPRLWENPKL